MKYLQFVRMMLCPEGYVFYSFEIQAIHGFLKDDDSEDLEAPQLSSTLWLINCFVCLQSHDWQELSLQNLLWMSVWMDEIKSLLLEEENQFLNHGIHTKATGTTGAGW